MCGSYVFSLSGDGGGGGEGGGGLTRVCGLAVKHKEWLPVWVESRQHLHWHFPFPVLPKLPIFG